MIATIISDKGRIVRVMVADGPIPNVERQRLERAGFTVQSFDAPRVRSEADVTEVVNPILQRDLFAGLS